MVSLSRKGSRATKPSASVLDDKYARKNYLSLNASKRWGELFFLYYSVIWIAEMAFVVYTEVYLDFNDWQYFAFGCQIALPLFFYPILFAGAADSKLPVTQRYWFKAQLWTALFNFIGNYFWTHYFFSVLGSYYTFPVTWKLNGIPIFLFLLTQAYFTTYFVFSTIFLRLFWNSRCYVYTPNALKLLTSALVVCVMSYIIAFAETFTIQAVPYYKHHDVYTMYTVGSTFYMLYFVIGFPAFARIDESPADNWHWTQAATESLASAMVVFTLCDFWRLGVGPIGGDTASRFNSVLPFGSNQT